MTDILQNRLDVLNLGVVELKNRWFVFKRLVDPWENSVADLLIENKLDFYCLEDIEGKDDVFALIF